MTHSSSAGSTRLDVLGLFLAGLVNTFLALGVAGIILAPGTEASQPDLILRAGWISEHALRWQSGWLFWFVVTLSFAWSYFALGRHLDAALPWPSLAIGVAVIAAAVDLVGVLISVSVSPELARLVVSAPADQALAVAAVFRSAESLAYALTNVVAFGLYTLSGLLLLPAAFATGDYPRWLVWLGVAEWGIAAVATGLLVVAPDLAMAPLLVSFALYAPWVWGSGIWLLRTRSAN